MANTLIGEDVAAYEDSILQRAQVESEGAVARPSPEKDGARIDPNDGSKPLPGDRVEVAIGTVGGVATSSAAESEATIMGR